MIKIIPQAGNSFLLETEGGDIYEIRDVGDLGLVIKCLKETPMIIEDWRDETIWFKARRIRINNRC